VSQAAYSPRAYRQGAVLSASPERLVVMLYDGARRFLHQAAAAMREQQVEASHVKLRQAEEIIMHLRESLDLEQGEVAVRLQSIYLFCQRHLRQARISRNPAHIEQVSVLLGELREAWATIEDRTSESSEHERVA
jgi:flagellar secretion chaperone FliS